MSNRQDEPAIVVTRQRRPADEDDDYDAWPSWRTLIAVVVAFALGAVVGLQF